MFAGVNLLMPIAILSGRYHPCVLGKTNGCTVTQLSENTNNIYFPQKTVMLYHILGSCVLEIPLSAPVKTYVAVHANSPHHNNGCSSSRTPLMTHKDLWQTQGRLHALGHGRPNASGTLPSEPKVTMDHVEDNLHCLT